jgi:hypothetical protein
MGFRLSQTPPFHSVAIEEQHGTAYEWMQFTVTNAQTNAYRAAWESIPSPFRATEESWRLRAVDSAAVLAQLRTFRHPVRSPTHLNTPYYAWPAGLPPIPQDPEGLLSYGGRAVGWPLLCVRSMSTLHALGQPLAWRGSLRIIPNSAYPQTRDPQAGCVPLWPIPLPFLGNSLLFATPWLFFFAPRALRRTLRLRRGHCPACGYNVQRAYACPCPECGRTAMLRA